MAKKDKNAGAPAQTQEPAAQKGGNTAPAEVQEPRELDNAQKAAAVIVALGAEKASMLYQFMEAEDIEALTIEVAKLGILDAPTTESVLDEFYRMSLTNKAVSEGGLDYARSVLEKAFGGQAAAELLAKVSKSLQNRQFSFLAKAREKDLFTALQYERPQTIALVLA